MALRIALRALLRNRVRSALTMLGVIIGVAAVIAMVAIGQGATESVQQQISSMGESQLIVLPGSTSSGAVTFGAGTVQTLTPEDAEIIKRDCPLATAVAVVVRTRAQITFQDANWAPATVQGCNPEYFVVRNWHIAEGQFFTESDVRTAAQVCVVGQTVADNLFGGLSPVGQRVRLKGMPFRVLGLLQKKGANTFGRDQDDAVFLPYTTVKKKIEGSTFDTVDRILVGAQSMADLPELEQEVTTTLRAAHHLLRGGGPPLPDDFTVRNLTEMLGAMTATTGVMTSLLAAIASVSLLVGGIGIMNIMLVSVTERTREIGLRMAVGARSRDVLSQFLVESMVLSGIGGLLGIALGVGGALAISHYANWPALVSPAAIVVAVVFSAAVGILFGFYPAFRASRLDPIDALRYE